MDISFLISYYVIVSVFVFDLAKDKSVFVIAKIVEVVRESL